MPVANVNDLELYFDTFGSRENPALLLIAGLGSQCTNYAEEWCWSFADRGLFVIRFDNRDCGLSTKMSADVLYSLSDLALDAVGLLDVLEIDKAHIWGSSLGGMVAQTIAIEHPERVASLISVQATTGEADVGQPDPEALNALLATFGPADSREAAIANAVTTAKVLINNEAIFDEEYQRDKASAAYDRSYSPEGSARQAMAVMGATDRASALAALSTPALVIHGNRDPLIDISGGRRTAELIAGAQFVEIDGMGHDLSRNFWSQYVDAVVSHVAASESKGT